jgi:DNA invertase Pin-like site-specific DNA recombinase
MLSNEIQSYTYGIYARKSSESEDKQIQSIERQIEELLELQHREQFLVYDSPIEESKSAFSIGREGFNKLVKLTKTGKINAWLCWHANRLSRNPVDAGIIIHLMDLGKLDHIRTPTRIYYNTPTDKMMLQIEFTMSKKDSDDKSIFVKSGLEKRYKKGFPTGKAPIGYLNNKLDEVGNRGWLVDEKRFEKLRLIFKRFLKGEDSISTITNYARDVLDLTTPVYKRMGGKLVGRSFVAHTLKNPIYAGFFYSLNKDGKQTTRRELHKNIPRLISGYEHLKILQILRSRIHPKLERHNTLYQGLIKGPEGNSIGADLKFQLICDCKHKFSYRSKELCPNCGIPIDEMESPKYLSYTYYYNVQRRKNKTLKAKCIEESKINKQLLSYFRDNLYVHPFLCNWAKKHLKEMNMKLINHEMEKLAIQEKQLQEINNQKNRLLTIYSKGYLKEEQYISEVQKLDLQITQLQENTTTNDWVETITRHLELGKECLSIFENGSFESKRSLLEEISSNLIWDEENLNISNDLWLNSFINSLQTVKSKYPQFEPGKPLDFKGSKALFDTTCPIMLGWLDTVRTYLLSHKGFRDK